MSDHVASRRPSSEPVQIDFGQRFQEVRSGYLGRPAPVWAVERVFSSQRDELRYAQLVCTADPTLRKTLAVEALADRRRFRRVAGNR